MSYKIILDSCGELTTDMKKSGNYANVPLTLHVGENKIIDDETFNQAKFLDLVASTTECPKSACPSPEQYINAYGSKEKVYAVTLSSQLSGSYNSAVLAERLHKETFPKTNVHVFDSKSASAGQTLIGMKIAECEEQGMSFTEVIEKVEEYIKRLSTLFVLEDLSFLERNGRLTGLKKIAANLLNIVPIMSGNKDGSIYQLDQARGIKKAMSKFVNIITTGCIEKGSETLVIAHCNCFERALDIKEKILEKVPNIKIYINDTQGVSSLYAGNKGIIVAYD